MGRREEMDAAIVALTAEVDRNTSVDDSAVALINGFAAEVEAAKNDPQAVQQVVDRFRASTDALAAAVAANTGGTGNGGTERR
jgi:N-acetylglutamate synthase/N-acetylornithine aminotransferase